MQTDGHPTKQMAHTLQNDSRQEKEKKIAGLFQVKGDKRCDNQNAVGNAG